mmetsp:Transcript_13736/g.39202  ORF Transcript_13736/g.39202 Transcript_13736/m.39202 type:complete len:203 (+) Transcript_13736:685-1293(+)
MRGASGRTTLPSEQTLAGLSRRVCRSNPPTWRTCGSSTAVRLDVARTWRGTSRRWRRRAWVCGLRPHSKRQRRMLAMHPSSAWRRCPCSSMPDPRRSSLQRRGPPAMPRIPAQWPLSAPPSWPSRSARPCSTAPATAPWAACWSAPPPTTPGCWRAAVRVTRPAAASATRGRRSCDSSGVPRRSRRPTAPSGRARSSAGAGG